MVVSPLIQLCRGLQKKASGWWKEKLLGYPERLGTWHQGPSPPLPARFTDRKPRQEAEELAGSGILSGAPMTHRTLEDPHHFSHTV